MKKLLIFLLFLLISNSLISQSWFIQTDSSAFDGFYKICGVHGKSNDEVFTSPTFVAIHYLNSKDAVFYLASMPYGGCSDGLWPIKIKFDDEEKTYQITKSYSNQGHYFLMFVSDKVMQNRPNQNLISLDKMVVKLKSATTMYLRYQSSCVSIDIEFPLIGASEALEEVL